MVEPCLDVIHIVSATVRVGLGLHDALTASTSTGNSLDSVETSFALHIISRDSGKPAISNAATRLAHQYQNSLHTDQDNFTVEQSDINSMLEGNTVEYCGGLQY